jgi:hypothetical protein
MAPGFGYNGCLRFGGRHLRASLRRGRLHRARVDTTYAPGLSQAGDSRYRTFSVLILVGCYLVFLTRSRRLVPLRGPVLGLFAVVTCLQLAIGIPEGISGGRTTHRQEIDAADVVVNFDRASSSLIANDVYLFYTNDPGSLRQSVRFERRFHLSTFGNQKLTATYEKQGLDVGIWWCTTGAKTCF